MFVVQTQMIVHIYFVLDPKVHVNEEMFLCL